MLGGAPGAAPQRQPAAPDSAVPPRPPASGCNPIGSSMGCHPDNPVVPRRHRMAHCPVRQVGRWRRVCRRATIGSEGELMTVELVHRSVVGNRRELVDRYDSVT